MGDSLTHLAPFARDWVSQPEEFRLAKVQADRWISYPKAKGALKEMTRLISLEKKLRMPNMLLVGPTNNGKTMITEKFRRDKLAAVPQSGTVDTVPVLRIQMPSVADQARFFNMVIMGLNAPTRPRDTLGNLETQVITLLKATGVRMLIIDEIHNMLAGTNAQLSGMLNLLRFLGNELQIPIVAVGVKEAFQAIHSDPQLANRFSPYTLPRWQAGEELDQLLVSFEQVLPLRMPSNLYLMADEILALSEGTVGEIADILSSCAELAITSGVERIEKAMLRKIDYMPPSERQRAAADMLLN